jgi:cobalamin biosynthesis Co2+ chelatase CbiK
VETALQGIGERDEVQELFAEHAKEASEAEHVL